MAIGSQSISAFTLDKLSNDTCALFFVVGNLTVALLGTSELDVLL